MNPVQPAKSPLIVNYISRGDHGHRVEYDLLLTGELEKQNIQLKRVEETYYADDKSHPFFFSMLDSHLGQFFLHSIWGSLTGRPTVGLFFRPASCFSSNSLKYRLKRLAFRAVSRLKHVHVLGLVPFEASPSSSLVASDWIYDPQLWDLLFFGFRGSEGVQAMREQLQQTAQGRRLIIALGGQNQDKGFDYLVDLWCSSEPLRRSCLFVVAGKVEAQSAHKVETFVSHGGLIMNRRISDDELMNLYHCADVVWSCYSPDYDQASGIFGRAVQLGVPVAVRKESQLEKLGALLEHPTLAVPFDDMVAAARTLVESRLSSRNPADSLRLMHEMRSLSVSRLASSLRPAGRL